MPAPLQALDEAVLQKILVLYRDVVRRVLQHTAGYEAQESEGTFMLAFPRPMKAIQFCLLVTRVHRGKQCLLEGVLLHFSGCDSATPFCLPGDQSAQGEAVLFGGHASLCFD